MLAVAVLLAVTACLPTPSGPAHTPSAGTIPPPTAGQRPSRIPAVAEEALNGVKINVWYPWFGVEASLFESQAAEFSKSNEWGITVQPISQNSYTELYSQVTTALPSENRPQLVVALPEEAIGWDAAGYVVDLSDYVSDPTYGLPSDAVDDFPAPFWSQDDVGGRRLAMPAERGIQLLLYNTTWAKELGFAAAPRSSAEFRGQACRAHQSTSADQDRTNDSQGGWLLDTSPMTFLSWMTAFGGGVLEGTGYHFLTPKNLAALTFVKQLFDDGCSWITGPAGDGAAAFAARDALFGTAGIEQLPDFSRSMAAANNGDTWTVLGFPGTDQVGLVTYGSSYIVLKSSPEQQLASWLFVRWLLSPENQQKWVEVTGLLPLRTSALALLGDYKRSHPQWAAAVDLIPKAQIQPQLASWRMVRVMVGDGFDAMFRSNTAAGRVAEVLAIMDKTASDLSQ